MTAKELIEALSQFAPDTPVVVRGYEGGYNDVCDVQPMELQLNVNTTWYYGAHGPSYPQSPPLPDLPMTQVVYLKAVNHLAEDGGNKF